MTTIFSTIKRLSDAKLPGVRWGIPLMFCLAGSAIGQPVGKIGYVVSAKDRAQADALVQQGFAAYQAENYPQALGLLEQADRLKPDQADCWNLRGMVFLRQKTYDKAQHAFGRAVALDASLWAAQFNLAETAFQQKNYPRARRSFEDLLAQTNRFKSGSRWELVQYKTFLCCLLQGNATEANRKLAKLPEKGAASPAHLYAQAALAYQGKQVLAAQKFVAAAQAAFPAGINGLFADSLVQEGWQTPLPASAMLAVNTTPATPALLPNGLPPGVTLATDIPDGRSSRPYYVVDPRVEAAAAEPLPLPDAGVRPIVGKLNPALPPSSLVNAPRPEPKPGIVPLVAVQSTPVPEATPDVELEHRGLLLGE